ncbi:MAG TPA: carbohydrate binding domain-containing protein [Patescibacteria group bacterium]|nr:carbohydrate binding domain-containing protein [Patescibacteria group bacterium]
MNNEPPTPQSLQTPDDENSLQPQVGVGSVLDQTPLTTEESSNDAVIGHGPHRNQWRRVLGIALLVIGIAVGTFFFFTTGKNKTADKADTSLSSRIKSQTVPLTKLSQQLANAASTSASTFTVNGQVIVGNSLVLQPTAQPTNGVAGQIYYDKSGNTLQFFNGTQFLNLVGSTTNQLITNNIVTTNSTITNITNIFGGATGGVSGTGTPGTIAMFTGTNALADSLINQSGTALNIASTGTATVTIGSNAAAGNSVAIDSGATGTLQVGNSASAHTIQIGTGAGVQTTTLGSGSTGSSTTVHAGTGGLAVGTGNSTGVSGSITLTTGNSSTTASGNITIDTGTGIIDGLVIENKTFETGLDNMNAWFGNVVAQSTAQAHSGTHSLAETSNAANWGVIETLPGVGVTAGHQYLFSLWVRAATTPRNITARAVWIGTSGSVTLSPVADSTTGWTEMTGLGVAPGGATSVYWESQSTGVNGETHYYDDITVTDLSSASAASVINIGNANAKIVTIGNINQIGATSIYGGSGINLNSGAGGLTLNGGVISIAGSAPSSISTSAGALTVTSAESASWGISTAVSGVGGDLTLHAGRGGTDNNNNGGNVIIQGGAPNGTGLIGSVIIKPPADTTNAFQLQNSTGVPLLVTDTTSMMITIQGTDTAFTKLVTNNAHIGSTQTTPPTIATPTNCGTAPTAALTAGSTDTAGTFTITTGTGGTSSTCDAVLTFHQAYAAAPKTILVMGKTDAASAARQIYVSTANATTFTVSFGASAAGANSTAYSFSYWVVE